MPDEIVRVHSVSLDRCAAPAVNVTFAVAPPEPANTPEKDVDPQPDSETVGVPLKVKDGRVTSMVSEVFTGTFKENVKDTDDAELTTGVEKTSWVFWKADSGCVMAGEVGIATAFTSVEAANTAATVLELSLAFAA